MGAQIKVLQKGKITIPSEIREVWGVQEGDYLTVELRKGKLIVSPADLIANPTDAIDGLVSGTLITEPLDKVIKKAAAWRAKKKLERSGK